MSVELLTDELATEWPEIAVPPSEITVLPDAVSLIALGERHPDPNDTLLGDRFLCRKGGLLLVGPSGIGKSSASVQQDILWALGRPAFGIVPAGRLRILTIQAENDDGDLGEMMRGVAHAMDLTVEDMDSIRDTVLYASERSRTGTQFLLEVVEPLLAKYRPDIIRIDPLLAYLGADVNDAKETAAFLRTGLNSLLEKYNCGAIINHHTPKVINRDTSRWRQSDWMYAGAGSADITNWARAILAIDPTYAPHVFKFHAAKRGGRIGWRDEDGEKKYVRFFCHDTGGDIAWRDADQDDISQTETKRPKKAGINKTKEDLLDLVPASGAIPKQALLSLAQTMGLGYNRARGFLHELIHAGDLFIWKVKRPRTNPEIQISRTPQVDQGETLTGDSHTLTARCMSPNRTRTRPPFRGRACAGVPDLSLCPRPSTQTNALRLAKRAPPDNVRVLAPTRARVRR
jgi:hypothetical protein